MRHQPFPHAAPQQLVAQELAFRDEPTALLSRFTRSLSPPSRNFVTPTGWHEPPTRGTLSRDEPLG